MNHFKGGESPLRLHIRNGKVEREKREITTQQLHDVTPLPKNLYYFLLSFLIETFFVVCEIVLKFAVNYFNGSMSNIAL